ncbi:MAG TPA: thiamine diphosphokinase [Fimbriimonadales bacterium]|nr:thiamine diphosphokinase [Fimbriimonadales bacterium]
MLSNERVLIVLHGGIFLPGDLEAWVREATYIVAANGGSDFLAELGVAPNVIIGDFDGISPSVKEKFSSVEMLFDPSQDTTDVQKVLDYTVNRKNAKEIVFIGSEGDRLDHTICALGAAGAYADKARIRFVFQTSIVHILTSGRHVLSVPRLDALVSLVPLLPTNMISSRGLKWEVDGMFLALGTKDGISNRATQNEVFLEIESGCLAVFVERCNQPVSWEMK